MSDRNEEIQWRILAGLGAAAAGWVARKGLATTWAAATGNEPPANPESPETTWKEAVAWAVVSGVVFGLARLLAERQAAAAWRKRKGSLPKVMQTVA